jgi:competence protein ComEC
VERHPAHVSLAALIGGLLLARRPELAAPLGGAGSLGLLAWTRGRTLPLCLAVAVIVPAGAWLGSSRLAAIDGSELRGMIGRDVVLRGFVVRREHPSFGAYRFRLRVRALVLSDGAGARVVDDLVQVRLRPGASLRDPGIGDEVEAAGTLELPRRSGGEAQDFDYAAYLHRAGVHAILQARWARRTGGRRRGAPGAIDSLRRGAEAGVSAGLVAPLGALARGMVLGEDEDIPAGMSDDFKRSGLAHVLAVSGQNVTLLAILAWPLLGLLGVGRRLRLVAVLALIALYVPLTGAGPSIMRAGVMGMAATVAALAGRAGSRWHALLLAAAVTLALDPRSWQDVGWQLSFAAVAGIFFLVPALQRASRLPEPLAAGAALTIAATIATAPLMAYHFGRVSLVSLPANLIAAPAIAPVMWIGMLSSAAAQIWLPGAEVMNGLNGYLLGYVASVAHWSAAAPGAVWGVRIASPAGLATAYAALGATAFAASRLLAACPRSRAGPVVMRALGIAAALAAVLFGASLARPRASGSPARFTASFLDVGQGDATLFRAPEGATVLVDGGPPEAGVVEKLRDHGVESLDAVVLTHAQRDHEGGLEAVLRELRVNLLIDGGRGSPDAEHRRIVAQARAGGTRVVGGTAGERLRMGGLRLRVLSPGPEERPGVAAADPNLRAIVLLVSYRGLDFFMPADAESDVTARLRLPRVDVLKVAHHGSADEGLGALLERLDPAAAVIEVGSHNPYGHPDRHALAALRARVPRVFRTDRDGEVEVTLGPHGPAVSAAHH